jgi:divalent metal cation (Fe/Co/Zn/Cd) transporter
MPWMGRGAATGHGHSHGLVDPSIKRSRAGLRAVSLALLVLAVTAAAQAAIFALTGSIALLADLIHNAGDALTAVPLGIAFAARSVVLGGLDAADPLIGLAMSAAIVRITWRSWQTVRAGHAHHHHHRAGDLRRKT